MGWRDVGGQGRRVENKEGIGKGEKESKCEYVCVCACVHVRCRWADEL